MKKKKIIIITISLVIFIFSFTISLGRYIYNFTRNHYLASKNFYFNSSVMSEMGSNHSVYNWDGVNAYQITIDVNSKKNSFLKMEEDLEYDINVECVGKIRCITNKNNGIIHNTTNLDSYVITVYPNGNIQQGETFKIKTSATSKVPYKKQLMTTYEIGVKTYSFSYKIRDSVGADFLTLELNNAFAYYQVIEKFGKYNVGDKINKDDYVLLTEQEKSKCKSAIVTLNFDPNITKLDMTNPTYIKKGKNIKYRKINNFNYVYQFTFNMDANTTKTINFYKKNKDNDYSYPIPNPNSIVTVTVDTVI